MVFPLVIASPGMRWRSADGVWLVSVIERGGELRYEIARHGGVVRSGRLTVIHAHQELDAALVELGGPALAEMIAD